MSQCIFKCLGKDRAVLNFLEWNILIHSISKQLLFFNENIDMHIKFMVLLNGMVDIKWVGFGILLCEMFILRFCSCLPSFFLSSMWEKENFYMWNLLEKRNFHPLPSLFSPSQPGIQNCFHLLALLLGPWQVPAPGQDHHSFQPGQGWGALLGDHMWETYFTVAFFGF